MKEGIQRVQEAMERQGYVTDRAVATSVHLSATLGKPLLVEGHPGVGKTEIAKVLAAVQGADLIRLQCYEGLDATTALYEWNYPKQLLHIRLHEAQGGTREEDIFSERFLLRRPLLQALTHDGPAPVLLIDEVDRADEEFEAFLLEVLADSQVTIPELGTLRAKFPPRAVLTSNAARELSDALKRRCLHLHIDFPDRERELRIVRTRAPDVPAALASQVVSAVERIRRIELKKPPSISETLDWARSLVLLNAEALSPELVAATLNVLLKHTTDVEKVRTQLGQIATP